MIFVVERREMIREFLKAWLADEFAAVTAMANAGELVQVQIPEESIAICGIAECEDVHILCPTLPIIVMLDPLELLDTTPVRGMIPFDTDRKVALAAVKLVLAGGEYLPARPRVPIVALRSRRDSSKLTQREQEVLDLLGHGMRNQDISLQLHLSLSTVKAHIHAIIKKMRAVNRTEAVVKASEMRSRQVQSQQRGAPILATIA